ncbi:beta-N-acetylhexosaminidase [Ureibacillus sp. FSL K6-0165]|uniref:beta-N-acetylhexosaminidase n=1 Tax=Ureibacillus sp. FSL K6-0165 TaxID=2954606 RepID=UPI0030FB0FB4
MKKGIIISFIILVTSAFFIIFVWNGNQNSSNDEHLSKAPPFQHEKPTAVELIQQIMNYAAEGKVYQSSIIAGNSTFKDVEKILGSPERIENTTVGSYAYYPAHNLSIGMDGQQIFDIRSYDKHLSQIHMQDIQDVLGAPEQTTYYEDETTAQIILYYTVNDYYLIKWILPKPSNDLPNPKVHHISILTKNNPSKYANLVDNMTLEEKIGQMFFIGFSGEKLNDQVKRLIVERKIGGIIFFKDNLQSSQQITSLLNEVKSLNNNNKYPIFLGIDQEGGSINRLPKEIASLPTNYSVGLKNNEVFAYEYGKLLGKQLATFGFNLNFAPVLDVNSNPNNPVISHRAISHDPTIVAALGIQMMKGIQSENIIPVIKHFPGHGDTSVDSHLALPMVNKSIKELDQVELLPFKKAIEENADVVMIAHILLPQIDKQYPASISKTIITELLREKLGFNGVVITDDMTMKAITNHYSLQEAALLSVKAGNDMILIAHDEDKIFSIIDELVTSVQRGEISEQRINESVMRILKLKEKYQLSHSLIPNANIEELNKEIHTILNKYN